MSGSGISFAESGGQAVTPEVLALAMQLAKGITAPAPMAAAPAPWGAQAATSWAAPAAVVAPGGLPQPTGVLIPLTVKVPDGSEATVYLQFGPDVAQPQALQAVIAQALQSGVPIKVWQKRTEYGGGGGGGYGGGGGGRYNGGGGGNYGRGGRY